MKHNKKRNPAFLYESLTTELSKSVLSKENNKKTIINIIKESFNKNKELYKELMLYRNIYETKDADQELAQDILKECKNEYEKLNQEKLVKEKNILIEKINKQLGVNLYQNFIPNYKTLATIFQVMCKDSTKVKKNILLEKNLIKYMIESDKKDSNLKPIDNLTLKTFMKKYNTEYDDKLNENQKKLVNEYIMSFKDNGLSFKMFLGEEIQNLKKVVNENIKEHEKLSEVINLLEGFHGEKIDKQMLTKIMKIYSLVDEIKNES